jgi:release factor glutamine methyltransferase
MSNSIAEVLAETFQILRNAGVPEARREATSLLAHTIAKDRTFLISHPEHQLSTNELKSFVENVDRRAQGEPLQYITGQQDFYGRVFRVSSDVLIPRPETELLVEAALELISASQRPVRICDVGTGSGCIAITLASENANVSGVALDISPSALKIAKQNAIAFNVDDRLAFTLSDCFDALPKDGPLFDLIASNPPYVAADVVAGLQREVKDHEPMVALTPGSDGLSIIRRLIDGAPQFLRKDGHLLLEIGFDQGEAVRGLVNEEAHWQLIDIRPDLQGIPRIVILRKTSLA